MVLSAGEVPRHQIRLADVLVGAAVRGIQAQRLVVVVERPLEVAAGL